MNPTNDGATGAFQLRVVGHIASDLKHVAEAPRQGNENAPSAWVVLAPAFERAAKDLSKGDQVLLLTWLHLGSRDTLEVHPRGDTGSPLAGVFSTRSPHRPNPIGLHPVTVLDIVGTRLRVGPIEAVDGTPLLDIKPVLSP